jgi:ATP-binding cassette subfamily F protein 3
VITLKNIHKSYGEKVIYDGIGLTIERGDKVALVGPNGAGKTTLLKILAGVLPFDSGERVLGYKIGTAYYAQHQLELLNPANDLMSELRRVSAEPSDQQLRSLLGAFLFAGDNVFKTVSVLSGGEKARLAIAKMLLKPANFILMDEPTNHLDIARGKC